MERIHDTSVGLPSLSEKVDKILEENHHLILAALDCQNSGRFQDCLKYQERLQRNLFYLASLADAQLNNVTASQLAPGNRQDYAMQKQPIPPGYFDKRQQQQLYSPRPGNVYANTTLQQSVMESSDVCVVSNRQSCFGTPETTVVPKFIESSNAISAASQQAATEQSVGQNSSSEEKREVRYWTQEEHERFVEGLSKYQKFGKPDLKAIAAYLGTRTPTQVRSHYQKYILKLRKSQQENSSRSQDWMQQDTTNAL